MHFLGGILQILLKQPPAPLDRAHGVRIAWGGDALQDVWRAVRGALRRRNSGVLRHDGMLELHDGQPRRPDRLGRQARCPGSTLLLSTRRAGGSRRASGGEMVVRERLPGALTRGILQRPEATAKALAQRCVPHAAISHPPTLPAISTFTGA